MREIKDFSTRELRQLNELFAMQLKDATPESRRIITECMFFVKDLMDKKKKK